MKTWGRAVASAFWFATVMAAAQVGVASMVGALPLDGAIDDTDIWTSRLTVLVWFAISSIVAGAYAGGRGAGSVTRLAASFAAGIGGAAGACLALYPLRTATLPRGDAQLLTGLALGFAAVAGFILAFGLLSARTLGWNASVTGVLVWGLLVIGVVTHPGEIRLGQLDAPGLPRSFVHSFSIWGLPAMVALVCAGTAVVARVRGHHRAAVAFSGLAGPATIALAYAIAGPGVTDAQKIPWASALAAVIAGLIASLLVALPSRRTDADVAPDHTDLTETITDTLPDSTPEPHRRRPFADSDDRPFAPRPLG